MKKLKKAMTALFQQISDYINGKGGSDSVVARVIALLKGFISGANGGEE